MKPEYGNWTREQEDYPKDLRIFAKKRIEGLLHKNILSGNNLSMLLESAYLQGIMDAAEATRELGN